MLYTVKKECNFTFWHKRKAGSKLFKKSLYLCLLDHIQE